MTFGARPRGAARPHGPMPVLVAALLAATCLPAQDKPSQDEEELRKAQARDPYTEAGPEAMARAGVVAYGPFVWADHKSTADIDRVLGQQRMLWMETAHFRIGSALPGQGLPGKQDARKALLEEVKALRKDLPAVPASPRRLDPWLRMHLFAARAERCYADIQALLGVTDADFAGGGDAPGAGPYLGQPDKFLLLLFQKKSDLARYLDRFAGVQMDKPYRHHHVTTRQLVAVLCVEGFENFDDAALHRYTVNLLVHNLLNAYRGFYYALPFWLEEGLAHWYSQRVVSEFITLNMRDDDAVDLEKAWQWAVKVRRRAEHESTFIPFATMLGWKKWDDLGFHAHLQSWSRVDFLMAKGPQQVGEMITALKKLAPPQAGEDLHPALVNVQRKALLEIWGLDEAGFDREWRDWVRKTYPKK